LGYEVITLTDTEQQKYFTSPIYECAKTGLITSDIKHGFMCQFDILNNRGAQITLGACSEIPLIVSHQMHTTGYIDVFELVARNLVKHCYSELYAI